jgi:hypothetical protein
MNIMSELTGSEDGKIVNDAESAGLAGGVYARYMDDGPNGICGQACSITNPWDKLYIFADEIKFREFARYVENIKHRKNPRIEGIWGDNYGDIKIVR